MSCKYTYKSNIYTEAEIKDLILEQEVLKNNPLITFTKKIFKTLPYQYKEDVLNEGSKKYGISRGKSTATIKYSQADQNRVNFGLKSVDILQSDKAKQIFDKGIKNNWSLDKILNELQIPKEQKQLILDLDKTNREEIITDLLANYSYTVEINTSEEGTDFYGAEDFRIDNTRYYTVTGETFYKIENDFANNFNKESVEIDFKEFEKAAEQYKDINKQPTQHYSNLTVPGGTNYTENEIATPAITPSIKGHAQFSTNNGVGWFRSDDATTGDKNVNYGDYEDDILGAAYEDLQEQGLNISFEEFKKEYKKQNSGKLLDNKTRRILEVQSDLFQKGRDKKFIANPINQIEYINKLDKATTPEEYQKIDNFNMNKGNTFLQLLNKDNNWVTFFVKSIIQDTAKQTVTEVQQEDVEAKVRELEKEGLLEIDCKGLKAEKGLVTSFTKGGTWEIYEIFEGKSHKQGGIDINIKNNQISFTNKNGSIKAKYGLVVPKEN